MIKAKSTIFYIIFFLFCLAFSSTSAGYDYDLWARLIAGMSVVQSGVVLKHDFLSYTPTHTWFDHEWGSGVIFYLTQHFFSSAGLLILQAILVFLIFFTITKIIKLRGIKTTTAYNFLFYFFTLLAVGINFNELIRCQMFTFLFFTVFLYILELARTGKNKPLILLPFLIIIWNNLHGGCVAGIGLVAIYALGEFLNKKPFKKYILTLLPTTLFLLINPWGLSYIGFLLNATTMQRPDVMEWWGMFSKFYMYKYVMFKMFSTIMLLTELIVVIKSFSLQKLDKTKFILLAITFVWALMHVKMAPFFVITSCCFIYDDFYTLFNTFWLKFKQFLKISPNLFQEKFLLKKEILIYAIVIVVSLSTLKPTAFQPILRNNRYPCREVEFIKINNLKGKLLVNFGLGSYVSYKLYPSNLIFMDGRYEEVYYDYMVPLLKQFYFAKDVNKTLLFEKFPPDVMIVEKFYPVYLTLKSGKEWKLVFESEGFGVFVKAKNAKKAYKQPSDDIKYYKRTFFDTKITFKKSS